ncbi:MAG: hypothetical protein J7J57_03730 [Caldisericaceae bacterium]|nr:hypothetical protein [Caldisericaceae bacterium]
MSEKIVNKNVILKKKKRRRKSVISKGTWFTVFILVAVFFVFNFYLMPKLFAPKEALPAIEIPKITRGDIELVDKQLQDRAIVIPPLTAPEEEIGKQNPFE